MGNTENPHEVNSGINEFINQQFHRLKQPNRNYLILNQVLQIKHPQDFPFPFNHLGILYICDATKDGIFTIQDFHNFTIWIQINMPTIQMYEFEAQLQSRTVGKIVEDLQKKEGEEMLVTWFVTMLTKNHRTKIIKEILYIQIDAVKTVYQVFNVQLMSDMDIQSFFYLVKRGAEDIGYNIEEYMENDEEDEYIVMKICEQFIAHYLKGIVKILRNIGYNTSSLEIK